MPAELPGIPACALGGLGILRVADEHDGYRERDSAVDCTCARCVRTGALLTKEDDDE